MKRFLLSMILVIGTTTIGLCSDFNGVYCKLWGMAFTYPIANIDATPYFKSITTGDEMIGAQTALIVYPGQDVVLRGVPVKAGLLKLNFGGITSLKANGMPYVSISLRTMKITTQSGETITDIAWGYGHDFKENKDHWLIGATFPLW